MWSFASVKLPKIYEQHFFNHFRIDLVFWIWSSPELEHRHWMNVFLFAEIMVARVKPMMVILIRISYICLEWLYCSLDFSLFGWGSSLESPPATPRVAGSQLQVTKWL